MANSSTVRTTEAVIADAPNAREVGGRVRVDVIGVRIDAVPMTDAVEAIAAWAQAGASKVVCACNVHVAVTARRDKVLAAALDGADLVVADGAPIAWMMRRAGRAGQRRVAGPDLMWRYFGVAEQRGQRVFLYGGSEGTLAALRANLTEAFPDLEIAGTYSPPYRELTADESRAAIARVNASGAETVWVALGCPRQEAWMAAHRSEIRAVMVGVGAAFDFHSGARRRAPMWMQKSGLEWLHRLTAEPKRLWRRYAVTNPVFALLALLNLPATLLAAARRRASAARNASPAAMPALPPRSGTGETMKPRLMPTADMP